MSDAITVKCPTCDHGRTIIFDHATSRVTGHCPRCSPDELTTFLTPDTKALVAEVERLRAERDALRDRLRTMNECVRIYVNERDAGGAVRPGWLEEEIAATDALLSDQRRNQASDERTK